MDTKLWVWYRTDDADELQGGHVVAWTPHTPTDEQGTPTGPTTYELSGYADCLVAAQIVDTARTDGALVWVISDFNADASLDNLLAVWGDDVLHAAVTHAGSNPSVAHTPTGAVPADSGLVGGGTDRPREGTQSGAAVQIEPS